MKNYVTEFKAISQTTGNLATFGGPSIEALSWDLAQQWCNKYASHLKVYGELVAEVSCYNNDIEHYQDNQLN